MPQVPVWQPVEFELHSEHTGSASIHDHVLRATFTSPTGRSRRVYGFWDGGDTWRVRFAPDEIGEWRGVTSVEGQPDNGLHDQVLTLTAGDPAGDSRFDRHGPIRVADSGRHFAHLDGTPFLWIGDTAWNGPMLSTDEEWAWYVAQRTRQSFSAVQWVATSWLVATGDLDGRAPFTGTDRISIDPEFFRRLDGKVAALARAGLLGVPVLLWAAEWTRDDPAVNDMNPGYALPDDQAVLLARYMVARWDAYPVAWILPGDGPYTGAHAQKWRRIGAEVFASVDHAPVTLHPNGMQWYGPEFDDQDWLDFLGYQSGHGDDEATVRWLVEGPPATGWQQLRSRPIVNLEPPYEGHVAYQSKRPFSAADVRKRLAWSLLVSPMAGVTYGGHGVWDWGDGTHEPLNHPGTGVPMAWRQAVLMPGAEGLGHMVRLLEAIDWWRLVPAPELVAAQPGGRRHIAAARSPEGDLVVVYIPEDRSVSLRQEQLPQASIAAWIDAANGQEQSVQSDGGEFTTPAAGDWWLRINAEITGGCGGRFMSEHLSVDERGHIADMAYRIRRLSVEMIDLGPMGSHRRLVLDGRAAGRPVLPPHVGTPG